MHTCRWGLLTIDNLRAFKAVKGGRAGIPSIIIVVMETELIEVMQLAILIGIIPAFIARNKGRNFFLWWFYGVMLFIAALPHSLWLKPVMQKPEQEVMKKCFYCSELIKREAKICQHCGKLLHD